jgi:hypothetical protein
MSRQGYRQLNEDVEVIAVRLPGSLLEAVDQHIERLRREVPQWATAPSRSDSLRDLLRRGLESLIAEQKPVPEAAAKPGKPQRARR